MSQGSNSNGTVTVANDGITVEKTVTADEFPVPAVVFVIRCEGSTPAHVRLIDQIPESFPMDRVGFHPEYESDRWTAYKDHRVEFERELAAGEEVKTVYGIRTDDTSDLSSFLTEPSVKELSAKEQQEATDIEGVLGPDNSQLVRDVLSGDRSLLSDVDGQEPDPLSAEASDPLAGATGGSLGASEAVDAETSSTTEPEQPNEPAEPDETVEPDETTEPDEPDELDDTEVDAGDAVDPVSSPETVAVNEGELSVDDEPVGPASVETAETDERSDDTVDDLDEHGESDDTADSDTDAESVTATADTDSETPAVDDSEDSLETTVGPQDVSDDLQPAVTAKPAVDSEVDDSSSVVAVQGGIAAVLAAELRNDNVSEEDRALLQKELGSGVPRSVEVRLSRVQSQVEDLSAYTDALEEFIDENGTATDIFGDLRADVQELSTEIDEISVELDSAAGERADFSADLASVRTGLNGLERDLEAVDEHVEAIDGDVGELTERVETAETTADDAADRVEKLDTSVSQLSRDVESATETADSAQTDAETAVTTASDAEAAAEEATESVEDLDTDLDHAFGEISDLGESVDDLDEQLEDVDSELSEMDEDIVDITDELESLDDTIRSTKRRLRGEIDELRERLEAFGDLDSKADAGELDAVGDRVDELEAEINSLQQFRNQLGSAFGGIGQNPDTNTNNTNDSNE